MQLVASWCDAKLNKVSVGMVQTSNRNNNDGKSADASPLFALRGVSRIYEARAVILVVRVGLESRMFYQVPTLSGGEGQRVAIARAIVNVLKLLIADEPTGSLDITNGLLVADLLFDLRKEPNMTIVIVTLSE